MKDPETICKKYRPDTCCYSTDHAHFFPVLHSNLISYCAHLTAMSCSCTAGFKNQRCDELANPCDYYCQNEGICTITALNKPRCK